MARSPRGSIFLITGWLVHTSRDVLAKKLGLSEAALAHLPSGERCIFPAAALIEPEPGGLRELHWHPQGDERQFSTWKARGG